MARTAENPSIAVGSMYSLRKKSFFWLLYLWAGTCSTSAVSATTGDRDGDTLLAPAPSPSGPSPYPTPSPYPQTLPYRFCSISKTKIQDSQKPKSKVRAPIPNPNIPSPRQNPTSGRSQKLQIFADIWNSWRRFLTMGNFRSDGTKH